MKIDYHRLQRKDCPLITLIYTDFYMSTQSWFLLNARFSILNAQYSTLNANNYLFPLPKLLEDGLMFLNAPAFLPLELLLRSRNSLDLGFALLVLRFVLRAPDSGLRVPCSVFRVPRSVVCNIRSSFLTPRSLFSVPRSIV